MGYRSRTKLEKCPRVRALGVVAADDPPLCRCEARRWWNETFRPVGSQSPTGRVCMRTQPAITLISFAFLAACGGGGGNPTHTLSVTAAGPGGVGSAPSGI